MGGVTSDLVRVGQWTHEPRPADPDDGWEDTLDSWRNHKRLVRWKTRPNAVMLVVSDVGLLQAEVTGDKLIKTVVECPTVVGGDELEASIAELEQVIDIELTDGRDRWSERVDRALPAIGQM